MKESPKGTALVLGTGIFGVTAALELRARGWAVEIADPGPLPHVDGASNDISKIVRADYGEDVFYTELAERSIEGWLAWNREWGWNAFERTGFLVLSPRPMAPGSYEHASYGTAVARGHRVQRLSESALSAFPAWNGTRYPDGYVSQGGGWSPSGRVVTELTRQAQARGIGVHQGLGAAALEQWQGRPRVRFADGRQRDADVVVVATGSWTTVLLPELEDRIAAVGQPVFHLRVDLPARYSPPVFLPWAADISGSGWYGFPALPDGRLKVANHGPGRPLHPLEPRVVGDADEVPLRAFLADALPELATAPIVARRLCVYTETFDNDFLIARHPDRPGVVLATGGSGHGYKFGPVLGGIVADAVEGIPNGCDQRFGWREAGARRVEPARFAG